MDSSELNEKLKALNIEDSIWLVYIGIIVLSWYSNNLEREYFSHKDYECKEKYRAIMILIFAILLMVYIYFLNSSYNDIKKLKKSDSNKKKKLTSLSFLASFLIVISGIIFLYIALVDDNLDIELAFN